MTDIHRTMQETMRLMRAGDLAAATQAIQRGMGATQPMQEHAARAETGASNPWLNGEFRRMPDHDDVAVPSPAAEDIGNVDPGAGQESGFPEHVFTCDAGTLRYRLFVPTTAATPPRSLVVMLHGCTQSPDDFARGTRLNALAQAHGCVVAYPEQPQARNMNQCWNWFEVDRGRGPGEAEVLAAMTRHLVQSHGLHERRVFAAGLSAGGAMVVALARAHPGLFAAIGVHSGLPAGVAHDVASAFAAMKQGRRQRTAGPAAARMAPVPVIVFHGDRDQTVHPRNGAAVVAQCMDATVETRCETTAGVNASVERGSVAGGRAFTRTVYTQAGRRPLAEHWIVHGGAHAWFGGDPAGSHADPRGPDASLQMLRFFDECTREAGN